MFKKKKEMKQLSDVELERQVRAFITRNYGVRCDACAPGCAICFAWIAFNYIFQNEGWGHKHGR